MSTHTIGGWNIEKGGFTDYATELPPQNPKQDRIARVIQSLGADSIVISDAQGWDNPAVRAACLPEYDFTFFTPLNDDWLTSRKPEQCNLGVAFATNSPIAAQEIIDLGDRQGVSTTLNLGAHGLRIAGVYLNHYSEDMRIKQTHALLAYLNKNDTPTVIIGDLNTQQARDKRRRALPVAHRQIGSSSFFSYSPSLRRTSVRSGTAQSLANFIRGWIF